MILFDLPYPDADRLVMLWDVDSQGRPFEVTYGTFVELAERSRAFEALAVADRWRPSLGGEGDPERLGAERVSADFFRVIGVQPALGRGFDGADDRPGAPNVAIVSAALAQRRLGGAEAALGRPLRLDGEDYLVVGVMPEGFENVASPGYWHFVSWAA